MKRFRKDGLRSLIGRLVEITEFLKEDLEGSISAVVLNYGNYSLNALVRLYRTTLTIGSLLSKSSQTRLGNRLF